MISTETFNQQIRQSRPLKKDTENTWATEKKHPGSLTFHEILVA